jgi:hypothetical protein
LFLISNIIAIQIVPAFDNRTLFTLNLKKHPISNYVDFIVRFLISKVMAILDRSFICTILNIKDAFKSYMYGRSAHVYTQKYF